MQSTLLVSFLCLVAVAVGASVQRDVEWEAFKSNYGRQYENPTEEVLRKKIFHDNKMLIDQHNQLYAQGRTTFTMGINQFADMTNEEFREKMSRRVVSLAQPVSGLGSVSVSANDSSVDWRSSGCVPAVKDQGQCSSSSVFSTTDTIEFCQCRKSGEFIDVSPQCLVDCCSAYGTMTPTDNYQCVMDMGGVSTLASYPLTTCSTSACQFDESVVGASIVGYVRVSIGSESELQSAVNSAIVSASIDASAASFQLYTSGVYSNPSCSSTQLDHSVSVVGYGTAVGGGDYWLIKNSWGSGWGERGYMRMTRNQDNQCGIATDAAFPIC